MSDLATIEDIVKQALVLDGHERAEFVRQSCGSDPRFKAQVESALHEAEQATRSWNTISDDVEMVIDAPLEGSRLGPYRFVRKLGSGGMGDVWLAERADEEYQQRVAIKLVRAGLFSTQVHGRLRMERQILASLQHPNIARLLDGGRAEDGTPYLVLEYIDGEPIDVYCDRRRLSLTERIRLFEQVCSAVQYAHQNLVVHRDLKPNNILITQDGVPKLLDFGIAKLLDNRMTAGTLAVTHIGYRVMTPAHASPEQIRGEAITTASDIYVLGVLLYELLAGRRPFEFVGSTLGDMERIVCERDPPAPTAMLKQTARDSSEIMADIATCRSTTPARLQKDLTGDLENIVLMAMRKDASRRYASCEQFATDLDRHLRGRPVIATGDTWSYRTRKFIRRHAVAVTAAAAAVAMLAIFATITFIQAQRIGRERDMANTERTRAEQVSSFLVELFELSDPSKSRGNQVTARELLDIGARRVSAGLADQPETRATLLTTIGRVYNSLGLYSDSIALLESALESKKAVYGSHHLEVANAMVALADALIEEEDYERAEDLVDTALQMQRTIAGETALPTATSLSILAVIAQRRGELDKAESLYKQSLQVFRKHQQERTSEAASVLSELAGLHSYRGDYAQGARLYRTALDIDRQTLGRDHPQVAKHVHNLAVALHFQGALAEAEPLYAESVDLLQRILGPSHPQTLDAMSNYGRFLHRTGDLTRAQEILSSTVQANRSVRGERHAYVGHDLVNLALVRLDTGDYAAAEKDLRLAMDIYEDSLPPEHPFVASALANIGRAELEQGRILEAERTLRRAADMARKFLPSDSPQVAAAKSSLGRALLAQDRVMEARPLLEESLPILAQSQGAEAPITVKTQEALEMLNGK